MKPYYYYFLNTFTTFVADGIFAVDALLARPGAYIRDPVLWQWQDDKGNWHTYGYNDCRVIEAAHVAGEEEVTLTVNGKSFTLNLASMHEIKEDSGTQLILKIFEEKNYLVDF